jgi:hypothetical protein
MRAALLKKGFRADKTHHEMLWFYAGDKKTSVKTRFSYGSKEYDDYLCGQVRRQIKLQTPGEFSDFMECPMDYGRYLALLKARGHVVEREPEAAGPPAPPRKKRRR